MATQASLAAPLLEDPSLPSGWKRKVVPKEGVDGEWDVRILGLDREFCSVKELETFLAENSLTDINPKDIDFSVFGQGEKNVSNKVVGSDKPGKKKVKDILKKKTSKKRDSKPLGESNSMPSSDQVFVKFSFKVPKRKRADSELSIDLEELESHPYQPCTPSPKKKVKKSKGNKENSDKNSASGKKRIAKKKTGEAKSKTPSEGQAADDKPDTCMDVVEGEDSSAVKESTAAPTAVAAKKPMSLAKIFCKGEKSKPGTGLTEEKPITERGKEGEDTAVAKEVKKSSDGKKKRRKAKTEAEKNEEKEKRELEKKEKKEKKEMEKKEMKEKKKAEMQEKKEAERREKKEKKEAEKKQRKEEKPNKEKVGKPSGTPKDKVNQIKLTSVKKMAESPISLLFAKNTNSLGTTKSIEENKSGESTTVQKAEVTPTKSSAVAASPSTKKSPKSAVPKSPRVREISAELANCEASLEASPTKSPAPGPSGKASEQSTPGNSNSASSSTTPRTTATPTSAKAARPKSTGSAKSKTPKVEKNQRTLTDFFKKTPIK